MCLSAPIANRRKSRCSADPQASGVNISPRPALLIQSSSSPSDSELESDSGSESYEDERNDLLSDPLAAFSLLIALLVTAIPLDGSSTLLPVPASVSVLFQATTGIRASPPSMPASSTVPKQSSEKLTLLIADDDVPARLANPRLDAR